MATAIEIRDLSKSFGSTVAVDRLDLTIPSTEIFGLLGPNAAGKSTVIRMLAGILRATAGTANILGYDLVSQTESIKRRIGYVAQHFGLYGDLSVVENLRFYAGLYGVDDPERLRELLDRYALAQFRHRRAGQLSGGYQRRLAIACATAHDPEVILLDEPTAGIDPVTRKQLWDIFYTLATEGKTLLVTTHYMEEAERCDRLAFLSHGQVIVQGTPGEILARLNQRRVYASDISYDPEIVRALTDNPGVHMVNQYGSQLRVIVDASMQPTTLEQLVAATGKKAARFHHVSPAIEDAFMLMTQDGNEA